MYIIILHTRKLSLYWTFSDCRTRKALYRQITKCTQHEINDSLLTNYAYVPPHRRLKVYYGCARSSASGRSHMRVLPPETLCPKKYPPVAAILGVRGVKGPPLSWVWGVTYKAVTRSFDAMLMPLFRFIYWLWTETVVVDQVLLWFRATLILSRIPDYRLYIIVCAWTWTDWTDVITVGLRSQWLWDMTWYRAGRSQLRCSVALSAIAKFLV